MVYSFEPSVANANRSVGSGSGARPIQRDTFGRAAGAICTWPTSLNGVTVAAWLRLCHQIGASRARKSSTAMATM